MFQFTIIGLDSLGNPKCWQTQLNSQDPQRAVASFVHRFGGSVISVIAGHHIDLLG